jgi:hypothetical protein
VITIAKRALVQAMEFACAGVDRLPDRLHPLLGRLGCPSGLASWSAALDEKWKTGVWKKVGNEENDCCTSDSICRHDNNS